MNIDDFLNQHGGEEFSCIAAIAFPTDDLAAVTITKYSPSGDTDDSVTRTYHISKPIWATNEQFAQVTMETLALAESEQVDPHAVFASIVETDPYRAMRN